MKALALLALTIGVANAQESILTYHGMDMTGTITSFDQSTMMSTSEPFDAKFTVLLDITGSLAAHDLQLVSGDLIASRFILDLVRPIIGQGGTEFCSLVGCIDLTTKNGQFTGATLDLSNNGNSVNIGPAGDSLVYQYGVTGGNPCIFRAPGEHCTITTANMTPGTWTVTTTSVPEIDPTSAASALTLLLGSLAVLRSRRKSIQAMMTSS